MIEKLIIKAAMADKQFLNMVTSAFDAKYFDDVIIGDVFQQLKEYNVTYSKVAPKSIIADAVKDSDKLFSEIDGIDFNIADNYDYLVDTTNDYLKKVAVKNAILDSVDIVNKEEDIAQVRTLIEDALCKDLKIDLGLDYFESWGERIRRIRAQGDHRVPSYFPQFDEYVSGGFPPYTLSVMLSRVHGCKSNTLSNFAARQVLHGHNVVLASMEMSEDAFAQRFDAIYSLQDINKIYTNKKELGIMMKSIKKIKKEALGKLFIKEFPTGLASTDDIRKYLRELVIRGTKPSIVYVDYINLMKPSYNNKADLYKDNKGISEELRALGLEFDCPIVSVSQLNREGSMLELKELDFTHIAESIGIVATADFVGIYGNNDDDMIYSSELWYKIVKNRLGGRIGAIDKFYLDTRSLKMYDSVELDQWIDDSHISNDERKMAEIVDKPERKKKLKWEKK